MIDEQNPPHEYTDQLSYDQYSTEDVLNQETEVGSPARKSIALIVIFALVGGFILYNTFSDEEEVKEEVKHERKITVADEDTLPVPPVKVAPPAPPEPIPMPSIQLPAKRNNKKDVFFLQDAEPSESAREDRLESKMMIVDQGSRFSYSGPRRGAGGNFADNDPNADFANTAYRNSEVEVANATKIGKLDYTIAQGKVVSATLETAINTDLPGTLRAIVSRDIYAEQGKNILIPKGSRLIGRYNSGITRGQRRVFIVWTRVIRPDGVDIQINSPGIDDLGRSGLAGIVDDKYYEIFSGAILTSLLTFGTALAAEEALGEDADVQQYLTDGGNQVTEGSPGAMGAMAAVSTLAGAGQSLINSILEIQPTIYVNQGTPIKVFVNRDLRFPSAADARQIRFID